MDELERLRLENAKLENEERRRNRFDQDVKDYESEKKTLKKSIWAKKNPRKVIVKRVIKRSVGGVGMLLGSLARGAGSMAKTGLQNYEANLRAEKKKSTGSRKRVVRVKKVKKRSGKKTKRRIVRKVKRRPAENNNSPFGYNPFN